MRKIGRVLLSRVSIVALLLCLQLGFFVLIMAYWAKISQYITWIFTILSLAVILYIVRKDDSPEFKLAWCIPILIFPIFGGLLYLIIKLRSSNEIKLLQKALSTKKIIPQDEMVFEKFASSDPGAAHQAFYVTSCAGFPVYDGSSAKYLKIGEEYFEELVNQLKNAEKFIFMEYFIISKGYMWERILSILEKKAARGVDVRVMYDSMGSLMTLPTGYYRQLEKKGIKCIEFNKFRPVMSSIQNNRDHRKICVIDGRVAFTGGINLGDEYINRTHPHGHWKDNAVMIRGKAVASFTNMFLEMWDKSYDSVDSSKYLELSYPVTGDGYIMPYGDIPGDEERVSESVYLNIISRANTYLYITTPYFIVGEEFITALELAAKGGVDVRIVTPYIWDKHFVHVTTRSYYERLIKAGVRVYEYTPGFIHAKTFLCDGKIATVGTSNLDYRSLYLQFECGVWLYGCKCISHIKNDILNIFDKSHEITLTECRKQPILTRLAQSVMRVFAPLF